MAVAAGKKAADNPGATALIAVIGLLVVANMAKRAADLPGQALGKAWEGFKGIGSTATGAIGTALAFPGELTDRALEKTWDTGRGVVEGIIQDGPLYDDDFGPGYYDRVHYDAAGVPIAVPVELDREAKLWGGRIREGFRRGVGDWSIPGF